MASDFHRTVLVSFNIFGLLALLTLISRLRPPFPEDRSPLPCDAAESMSKPIATLTAEQLAEFHTTGVLLVRGAVPKGVAMAARSALEGAPPKAAPLQSSVVDYAVNFAWYAYTSLGDLTFRGFTAAVATQLLNPAQLGMSAHEARLVNSIAYGLRRGQHGADWHVDRPSFHVVGSGATLSTWLCLSDVNEEKEGGSLHLVPANSEAVGRSCLASPISGRPSGAQSATEACNAVLSSEALSFTRLYPGDLIVFRGDVWHQTSPLSANAALHVRWSYTERWTSPNATLSGTDLWLRMFPYRKHATHHSIVFNAHPVANPAPPPPTSIPPTYPRARMELSACQLPYSPYRAEV